ncbi:unnamed protein product [Didymodactylos carnosus]|uniref:Uncharacterized protein n=1 Tax=Didymodactylos carnosus TaxID=1234261 RepID=A0A8S2F556_9BILA|nr:unnamed protein product [Didymodactylos carnosus]CAF4166895.1 unnamed protein product [Didymodactylos carnosus]
MQILQRSPLNRKLDEIQEYKTQRSMLQNVKDIEDRILRDSRRTQNLADSVKQRSYAYTDIMMEYEKLQIRERDLLRDIFTLQSQPLSGDKEGEFDSLSDYQKERLRSLQRKNAEVEKERRIIQEQLEELISTNRSDMSLSIYNTPHRLLRELKDQEDLNENALNSLRMRLFADRSLSLSRVSSLPTSYNFNNKYTRSRENFGDDVRTFRNDYLKFGGHNPALLARYTDLEYKLRSYENNNDWMGNNPEPLTPYRHRSRDEVDDRFRQFNTENKKLLNDVDSLQKKYRNLNTAMYNHPHDRSLLEPVTPYGADGYRPHHHHPPQYYPTR